MNDIAIVTINVELFNASVKKKTNTMLYCLFCLDTNNPLESVKETVFFKVVEYAFSQVRNTMYVYIYIPPSNYCF